jgi:phosphoribosylamine--glycine ligase
MSIWAKIAKYGGSALKGAGSVAKQGLKSASNTAVHPTQALKGAGSAMKTAAVGSAAGYVAWQNLVNDKSMVEIASDVVVGKDTTEKISEAVEDVKGLKNKAGEAVDAVNGAMGDINSKWSGMSNFFRGIFGGNGLEMFGNFFKNLGKGNVSGLSLAGLVTAAFLTFGLMLTEDGPKVLEYNARFGDPEAQVVLPRMKNDIIDVMEACVDGTLDTIDLQFEDNACVCVVLASDGYPVKYEKGFKITGFEKFDGKEDYYCYHAGTKFDADGNIVTNGGRVLGITATGATLKEARAKAYEATEWVQFDNKYMRHDIGKAIDEA